jgi:hypothetical protein
MSANATPENKSEHRKLGLKVLLGLALIGYVLKSKMVDFSALAGVLWSPANLALSLFFLLLTTIICSYRWFLLTRVQNLNLNFYEVFELMMIGVFVDIANVAIVFLLAILSWFLIERRILNYKERVWASAK